MFFLATADADGQPDCSYKGGVPGFVRVTGGDGSSFPSYDGNGSSAAWATCWPTRASGCCSWTSRSRGGCGSSAARASRSRAASRGRAARGARRRRDLPQLSALPPSHDDGRRPRSMPRARGTPPEPAWKKSFRDVLPAVDKPPADTLSLIYSGLEYPPCDRETSPAPETTARCASGCGCSPAPS